MKKKKRGEERKGHPSLTSVTRVLLGIDYPATNYRLMLNTGGVYKRIFRGGETGSRRMRGMSEGGSGSVRRSYHRVTGPGYRNFVIVTGRAPLLCRHCVPSSITAGPAVTRGPANLSLVPFHGETKISERAKPTWLTRIPSFLPPSRLKPTLGRNFHVIREEGEGLT